MLVPNQYIILKMSGTYSTHFKSLGYKFKYMDELKVPVKDLPESSHAKIKIQCDYCGYTFEREYRYYIMSQNTGLDGCKNCKGKKIKETCLSKYGVENVFQLDEKKKKSKETCLEKYGVEYASSSKKFRDAVKNTCFKKYGVDNIANVSEVKEKRKKYVFRKIWRN